MNSFQFILNNNLNLLRQNLNINSPENSQPLFSFLPKNSQPLNKSEIELNVLISAQITLIWTKSVRKIMNNFTGLEIKDMIT